MFLKRVSIKINKTVAKLGHGTYINWAIVLEMKIDKLKMRQSHSETFDDVNILCIYYHCDKHLAIIIFLTESTKHREEFDSLAINNYH